MHWFHEFELTLSSLCQMAILQIVQRHIYCGNERVDVEWDEGGTVSQRCEEKITEMAETSAMQSATKVNHF